MFAQRQRRQRPSRNVTRYRRKLHESRVRQSLMCNANATKRPNWSEIGHKLKNNFVVIQTEEDGWMTGC